jgi:adenine/guanine phosphoribosyltransferase-like PRPP-binding protein
MTIVDPARLLPAHRTPNITCAGHLRSCLDPDHRQNTVKQVIRVLSYFDFDTIAFRGLSGSLIAPTVAMTMNKTLLAVRKGEDCHSGNIVEGDYNAERFVIVDDMLSSGATVAAIIEAVASNVPKAKCIGVLQYLWMNESTSATQAVRTISETAEDYHVVRDACVVAELARAAYLKFSAC